MNTSLKLNLEKSTESQVTSSANGLRDLASECLSNQAAQLSKVLFGRLQALNPKQISTFGTKQKLVKSSTAWDIQGPISMRTNSICSQEIVDRDGQVIAWTTDEIVAHVICKLLND